MLNMLKYSVRNYRVSKFNFMIEIHGERNFFDSLGISKKTENGTRKIFDLNWQA